VTLFIKKGSNRNFSREYGAVGVGDCYWIMGMPSGDGRIALGVLSQLVCSEVRDFGERGFIANTFTDVEENFNH